MKYRFVFILLTGFFAACNHELGYIPDSSVSVGLFTPVQLNHDTTVIHLSDFFPEPGIIDSIDIIGVDHSSWSESSHELTIVSSDKMPVISELRIWIAGNSYSVILKKSQKQWVELVYDPGNKVHKMVQAPGEFNGWTPSRAPLTIKDGKWAASLLLIPGTYQYQFIVDGKWMTDPANPDSVDNNMGAFNSVLVVGQDAKKDIPVLYTHTYERCEIKIGVDTIPDGIYVFWENFLLPDAFLEWEENNLEIYIPKEARFMERSYLRIWAYNESGTSNEILIPLNYGRVLDDPMKIKRNEKYALILYNVFVDRFFNADKSNDKPVDDPAIRPAANHHGGDIKGITRKIEEEYFTDLGINTIWMSPVVLNTDSAFGYWPDPPSKFSGYHGYWPISFTQIDPCFGSSNDLQELVKVAHRYDLNILIDFVANHVHEEHPIYQQHPDWATELYLPDGSLNTERWDEYRLTTWFDVFLPTLDLAKPEVYEMLSDSAMYWIKTYNLDGFRHDATKHIPEVFWRTLTRKIKDEVSIPEYRDIYQIGETYGSPELISSYVSSGMLDGQFDFNVYDDALATFIRPDESFERLNASLQESLEYYGEHNLMGYITGNQDRGRFISYAGGDLKFEEDAKLAGWTRHIGIGDPVAYDKMAMLIAFNMSIPGIPVVYYGDEIGMPGGNDPDNRRMMRFDGLADAEKKLKNTVSKLANLRKHNMALMFGDFEVLEISKDTYVFARTYFNKIVVVIFNKGREQVDISFILPERFDKNEFITQFGGSYTRNGRVITMLLDGNNFNVLINQ